MQLPLTNRNTILAPASAAGAGGRRHPIARPHDDVWKHRVAYLLAGLFVFRIILVALAPLDLTPDEAYYWDWSRHLDWGYYSKPPLVAWLIRASTSIGGSTGFFVRLPAVVLGTGSLVAVCMLATRLYGAKVGFWATAATAAAPGNLLGSYLMTIDAPLMFFWCASLYCIWRVLESGRHRPGWIAAATIATGLGVLSKQTMLAFLPLLLVFLIWNRNDRAEIKRWGLWVWATLSLCFLIPPIWWNSRHGWVTLAHTGGHFSVERSGLSRSFVTSGEFILGQIGIVSPILCLLFVLVLFAVLRKTNELGRKEKFLICFSILPAIPVLLLSLFQRVQPNWPGVIYSAGMVLVAAWAFGAARIGVSFPRLRTLFHAGVGLGFVCCGLIVAWPFTSRALALEGRKIDPTACCRGWHSLADEVGAQWSSLPSKDKTFFIAATSRTPVGELAFYLPRQPQVYLWNDRGNIESQYDIWGGPPDKDGWDALIITFLEMPVPPSLADCFTSVQDRGEVVVPLGRRRHAYRVWLGKNFRAPAQVGPNLN